MAEYNENDYVIYEGLEERIQKVNKLDSGSEEELRAMKSAEIQYNLYLKEAEVGAKLLDLEERRKMEQKKIEQANILAEREQEFREEEAIANAEREKKKIWIGIGALGVSLASMLLGWATDHLRPDDIRNTAGERDVNNYAKDTRSFVDRLLGR